MSFLPLINLLKIYRILNPDNSVNVGLNKKLRVKPELAQKIVEATCFLHDMPLKPRIWCIVQNITAQPKCMVCNKLLQMRMTGVHRQTFPTYCSARCGSKTEEVKNKRKETNIKKYGHSNVLVSSYVKNKKHENK